MICTQHPYLECRNLFHNFQPNFLSELQDLIYTYNARGAIYQICRQIKDKSRDVVLIPKFHCPTVVDPVLSAGYKIRYYKIGLDLEINLDDLINKLDNRVLAVIVIHYFGFEANIDKLKMLAKNQPFHLIEDWAHSFLRNQPVRFSGSNDCINVYSFKKMLPIGTGGGYRFPLEKKIQAYHSEKCGIKESIKVYKDLADQAVSQCKNNVLSNIYYLLDGLRKSSIKTPSAVENTNGKIESIYPYHKHLAKKMIPYFSKKLLLYEDLEDNIKIRQYNFRLYLKFLQENGYLSFLHHDLPDDTVPWAFPILILQREKHDFKLRNKGVPLFTFGELLHPDLLKYEKNQIKNEKYLSNSLTLLPIHKKMNSRSIELICEIINQYFKHLR